MTHPALEQAALDCASRARDERPPAERAEQGAVKEMAAIHGRSEREVGTARKADSFSNSLAPSALSKTATPPIQPVKPTPRLLWITRPMVPGVQTQRHEVTRDLLTAA